MPLATGTKLGPYEIVSPLGAGGMGEVYRARDTRLDRTVAIKVLNAALAGSPELRARFDREARAISQLNHNNICTLYDVGHQDGTDFLVMELIEGESLAARLSRGPVPTDQLLKIAVEIAEALDKAHRAGIVHRDLKPGNIMLSKSGAKLLDFGLAKPLGMSVSAASAGSGLSQAILTATITQGAASPGSPLSSAGTVVGTVQYMSPEQVQGLEADTRSDIFAFGLVLFEMATGRRAFEAKTQSSLVGQILAVDPPAITDLQPSASPTLARAVRICLEKDPAERYQSAHDLKLHLQAITEAAITAPPQTAPPSRTALIAALSTAAVLLAALVTVVWLNSHRKPPQPETVRLEINLSQLQVVLGTSGSRLAISPDGTTVAIPLRDNNGKIQLYIRKIGSFELIPLPGTDGAGQPFFSPDGRWVGYSAAGKLKKVPITGGVPITICDLHGITAQASWGDDGNIVFDGGGAGSTFNLVPSGGGTPVPIETPDKTYRWPEYLPGGRAILGITRREGRFDIDLIHLDSHKVETIIRDGSWPRYLANGHIVYAQYSSGGESTGFTGGLLAVPFDLAHLKVTGSATPVLQEVQVGTGGAGFYDISGNGSVVYVEGGAESAQLMNLFWIDRNGKSATPIPGTPHHIHGIQLSPDGTHAMFTVLDNGTDIYDLDLVRNTLQRLTFDKQSQWPVFTPDGKRIVYASGVPQDLWIKAADGSGEAQRITHSKSNPTPFSISPDGSTVLYTEYHPDTNLDIYQASLHGDPAPHPYLNGNTWESDPAFSPDGKFVAYASNESGENRIYVQTFPIGGGKWQISEGDSRSPRWSRDGKALYYVVGVNRLMMADVSTVGGFKANTPRALFDALDFRHSGYDVARDGRILRAQPPADALIRVNAIRVIENFDTEVARRFTTPP